MKIGIASDHRGYILKEKIKNILSDYNVIDYGTNSTNSVDYPNYAFKIGESINNKQIDLGILICGTGIGMSIACNKVKNIRCAKVSTVEEAYLTRFHNDANVLAISENTQDYENIVKIFIETKFSNEEKHIRRIEMIKNYED